MKNTTPIFIVGWPRSGTTLLTAFLSSHSNIASGPETHFYNKLSEKTEIANSIPQVDTWPKTAVDAIANLHVSGRPIFDLYQLEMHKLHAYLTPQVPGFASLLDAIMQTRLCNEKKSRWLEKTPNHLLHVNEIRRDFPTAKIIRVVRDHRDIADSMKTLPWSYNSSIANAMLIEQWHMKSCAFFESDEHSITIRFENLLAEPTTVLKEICHFIGEAFEDKMIDRKSATTLANVDDEPWKKQVANALDISKAFAWQKHSTKEKYTIIDQICDAYTTAFNYKRVNGTNAENDSVLPYKKSQLLSAKGIAFSDLDKYATTLSKHKLCLADDNKVNHALLFFEGKTLIDLKLLTKALLNKYMASKTVFYIAKKQDSIFLKGLANILFESLSIRNNIQE